MRRRCKSLLCLRRLRACLRRQTTFALTCLCLIFGVTILALTFSFQNSSGNNANQIFSLNVQQINHDHNDTHDHNDIHDHNVIHDHNDVQTNNQEKNKRSLSELPRDSQISDSARWDVDFPVEGYSSISQLNEYEDLTNAASQTIHGSNSNDVQSYSTKHIDTNHISNNSHILNSALYTNHSSSIKQIKGDVLELIHSYIPETLSQQEKPTSPSLTKFKYASQRLLQVLSNVIPSSERVSLRQVLLHILNDRKVYKNNFQTYVNTTVLKQIIDNITNYHPMRSTAAHKDKQELSLVARNNRLKISNMQVTRGDETLKAIAPHHRRVSRVSLLKQLHYSVDGNVDSSALNSKVLEVDDVNARLVNGIYWSQEVEDNIPKGVSDESADAWIQRSRAMDFQFVEAASWNKCGRPKNAFAVQNDGSSVCVRYRSPNDRLLQGEVMSYWLARLLGLDNVPPVHLSSVDSRQWAKLGPRFHELGWTQGNLVAKIMWIQDIDSRTENQVLMPPLVLKAYREKQPVDASAFKYLKLTSSHTTEQNDSSTWSSDTLPDPFVMNTVVSLAQWGSMILFDYLTANYDRVASMQDGAYKENRPSIIEESIRNLRPSKHKNKLWLIDNEGGLIDAYDMMYRGQDKEHRFVKFHNDMLHTMCIFQRRVVQQLQGLSRQGQSHVALEKWAEKQEPLLKSIERDSSYELFKKHFSYRVGVVLKWIRYCEKRAVKR